MNTIKEQIDSSPLFKISTVASSDFGFMEIEEDCFKEIVNEELREHFPAIENLTDHQYQSLFNFIYRRDVFSILPTGSGKSLIFQIAPSIAVKLKSKGYNFPENPILIIICPLNALIDSHIRELCVRGYKAALRKLIDYYGALLA